MQCSFVYKRATMSLPALHLPATTGAKDADGKRVEFEPDPRAAMISRQCIQVPWHLYGRKHDVNRPINQIDPNLKGETDSETRALRKYYGNRTTVVDSNAYRSRYQGGSPMDYYLTDVLSDTRLDPMLRMGNKPNPTRSPTVQAWATAHALRPAPADAVWVMDFITMTPSEPDEAGIGEGWGRMCLVRQDSTTLLGRLYGALGHVEDSMTDQSMGNTYRPAARREDEEAPAVPWQVHESTLAFRDQRVQRLQHAIQVTFEKLSPSERAAFLAAEDASPDEPAFKVQRS